MSALLPLYFNPLLVFLLILSRVSGLVMTAPLFGARTTPVRVRALAAVGLSLMIAPVYWEIQVANPGNLVGLAVALGREALLGIAMGLALMILFAGFQLSGQIIGQISGMALADIFDPSFDASVPVVARLLDLIALAVFVAIGGHRRVMSALLDTFQWLPPGRGACSAALVDTLTETVARSFVMGIRAAAPIMAAVMMSVLIMGLISRTLPQLNVLVVGFSLNSTVMMVALFLSLGAAVWVFQEQVDEVIEAVRHAVANTEPSG